MNNELSGHIPSFISANTPLGLRRKIIRNNLRLAMDVRYYDFQKVPDASGKLKWYCWYDMPVKDLEIDLNSIKNLKGEGDENGNTKE